MCHQFRIYTILQCTIFIGPTGLVGSPVTLSNKEVATTGDLGLSLCDSLGSQGTSVLCFPPATLQNHEGQPVTNCSNLSSPGTIASYTCRGVNGFVYQGFLHCATSGVWIISLEHVNSSLCNLDASIMNLQFPDIVIGTDVPDFTTPIPNLELLQSDVSSLSDYEMVVLQLHNIFRRNHGVPQVVMAKQLNAVAQSMVNSIVSGNSLQDLETELKWNPINRTMNIEMNWYFQRSPTSANVDNVEAVNNAIQMWYSGFFKYDWNDIEKTWESEEAIAFSRIVWKATTLIGIGVSTLNNTIFVACLYTPGRNIESIDPVQEFTLNVPPVRIG